MTKKQKIILLTVLALITGIVTYSFTRDYLQDIAKQASTPAKPDTPPARLLVVARENIRKGTTIKGKQVAPVEFPLKFAPLDAITPAEFGKYNGAFLNTALARGQPLRKSYFSGKSVDRFSELIDDGETAVTLRVSAQSSNSYMLVPGDYVDILLLSENHMLEEKTALFSEDEAIDQGRASLIPLLSRVKVLSVDRHPLLSREARFKVPRNREGKPLPYRHITVSVKIEDATKLSLANDVGDIVFFLRNPDDTRQVAVKDLHELFIKSKAAGRQVEYISNTRNNMVHLGSEFQSNQQSSFYPELDAWKQAAPSPARAPDFRVPKRPAQPAHGRESFRIFDRK